jgi:hypothetical protein
MQVEPVPDLGEEVDLPEGLKRKPKGPYSRPGGANHQHDGVV